MRKLLLLSLIACFFATASTCRQRTSDAVTVALPEKFSTFDTLTSEKSDAAAERVKNLIFNTLVRKDANFDYSGELAKDISTSPDGLTMTFILRDGVKFHDGRDFTSADVKYTFDELFKSKGFKSFAFYDSVSTVKADAKVDAKPVEANAANSQAKVGPPATKQVAHIETITTPDSKTVVFKLSRASLKNQLLANLVAVPIIPEGSAGQQKASPIGSGPFKFVTLDESQGVVELSAHKDYWDGPAKIDKLRLKTVTDANSLQAELSTGAVDIAPNPNNIPADTLQALKSSANLKVEQSDGSNIQYLVFNTQIAPLNNVKVRQAIAYAIDRERIVSDLLSNQAKTAENVLPLPSWAYNTGTVYKYDPEKAKQLLAEAGYKNEPIIFKYGAGIFAVNQYAQVVQSSLMAVGLNVQIETLDANVARSQVALGQYGMYTGVFIGGNQDPIYLRDLFSSSKIPTAQVAGFNRSRYVNAEVDKMVEEAINSTDKAQAKDLYGKVWTLVSSEVPLLPLWYPANIVVSNKRIGNVKMSGSGDWGFLKDVTLQ